GFIDTNKTEQFLKQNKETTSARNYPVQLPNWERNPIAEMKEAEENGQFSYIPIQSSQIITDDNEDNFDDANETSTQSTIKDLRLDDDDEFLNDT
ncbi:unnamed protein product, partial [Rotaria socialis]